MIKCPPLSEVDLDYRDEIGEIVSSILLKGFQKLHITRLFLIPFYHMKMKEYMCVEGGHFTP